MILVAGSANLDFVVTVPHIPAPGETLLANHFATYPGGKGANQAVAVARAGKMPTQMLVALGTDSYGERLHQTLLEDEINVVRVDSQQSTGCAFINVARNAENSIAVVAGANHDLHPKHWQLTQPANYLLMQLEIPLATVVHYANTARLQKQQVFLNAAPFQPLPNELLANTDVLIVNEGELRSLTLDSGNTSIKTQIAQLSPAAVVVTLGGQGACLRVRDELGVHFFYQAAFHVDIIDTTGAGDTFCGALAAARARELSWQESLAFASAAGALACTKMGAQSSIPNYEEVQALLASQPSPATDALEMYCSREFVG